VAGVELADSILEAGDETAGRRVRIRWLVDVERTACRWRSWHRPGPV